VLKSEYIISYKDYLLYHDLRPSWLKKRN